MPIVDILGVPHAYELTTPTPAPYTLVFVHGWLLSRQYWQPLIEALSSDYQCLAYDLRGFGDSVLPESTAARMQPVLEEKGAATSDALLPTPGSTQVIQAGTECGTGPDSPTSSAQNHYTPAAFARDLAHLLQSLNISKAWLIGHSLGGSIALWGADQLQETVQGVICINAGGGIYLKEEFERFRTAGQKFLKFRPPWLAHLPLLDWIFCRANVARPVSRCWGKQRLVDFVNACGEAALGTLLDSTTEAEVHRLPQVIARLQQPVYFIAGEQDLIMEPKYVRHLASFHPIFQAGQDNVIEVPNCGHLAMVEQPQAIAAHIRQILANHAA